MSAHRHPQDWTNELVGPSHELVENSSLLSEAGGVTLATQVLNHLASIERKVNRLTFKRHVIEDIQ
jgi:hypothetical protein